MSGRSWTPGRRRVLGLLGGAATSSLVGCARRPGEGVGASSPSGDRRVIIVISVDSLRASRIGAYGYGRPTTPSLDRFAEQSFRFTRAWSECSWTKPAMASLFLARPVHEHLVIFSLNRTVLDGDLTRWLPEVGIGTPKQKLQAVARGLSVPKGLEPFHARLDGFKKAAFLNNPHLGKDFGFDRSWNVFRSFPPKVRMLDKEVPDARDVEEGMAPRIHRRSLQFIDNHPKDDFYVWIHHNDVHHPYGPVERHAEIFGKGYSEDEFRVLPPQEHHSLVQRAETDARRRALLSDLYDGGLRSFDDSLGEFFAALRSRGVFDEATIIVTADHGEEFWEHGAFGHGNNVFGETTELPLFLKLPRQATGRVIDAPASLADIGPTVLDIAGVATQGLSGRSLLPALGENAATGGRAILSELVEDGYELALVRGSHRLRVRFSLGSLFEHLNRSVAGPLEPSMVELYDLDSDPDEANPLVPTDHAELLSRLREELLTALGGQVNYVARLQEEVESGRAADSTIPLNADKRPDRAIIEQLEALGYM